MPRVKKPKDHNCEGCMPVETPPVNEDPPPTNDVLKAETVQHLQDVATFYSSIISNMRQLQQKSLEHFEGHGFTHEQSNKLFYILMQMDNPKLLWEHYEMVLKRFKKAEYKEGIQDLVDFMFTIIHTMQKQSKQSDMDLCDTPEKIEAYFAKRMEELNEYKISSPAKRAS